MNEFGMGAVLPPPVLHFLFLFVSALWSLPLVETWRGPLTSTTVTSYRDAGLKCARITNAIQVRDPAPEAVLGLDPMIVSGLIVPSRVRDLHRAPGPAPSPVLALPLAIGPRLGIVKDRGPPPGRVPGLALNLTRAALVVIPTRRTVTAEITR